VNSNMEKAVSSGRGRKILPKRKYHTQVYPINSTSKFDWQNKLIGCIERDNGFTGIMSRTGTGKSKASYLLFKEMLKMDGDSTTYYVPNSSKFLAKQVCDKFKEYLEEDGEEYDDKAFISNKSIGYKITLTTNGHKLYIKPFIANTKSPIDLLDKFNDRNFVIFDEFDAIQTQLGLIHGGCSSKYSKTTISEHQHNFEKTKFNFFERLCLKTKVFAFSATLDDTISHDLRSYENKININCIIVNHMKEHLENVKIEYYSLDENLALIVNAYRKNEKTLCYVASIDVMHELEEYLEGKGVIYYSWNSRSGERLSTEKINDSIISIFVNGPTRGLDLKNVKNVVLLRGLKASTKENKNMLSALANQIMGRIRSDGVIYRDDKVSISRRVDNLFDLVEQIYIDVQSYKYNYLRRLWRLIYNAHEYNNDYLDRIVRLFLNNWLLKDKYHNSFKGDSIPQRFKNLFIDNPKYKRTIDYIKTSISQRKLDDSFIKKYVEFEKILMEQYIAEYEDMLGIDLDEDNGIFKERISNSTGGGKSKPNISEPEKAKGVECLEKAIKICGLEGSSMLIKNGINKEEFCGEFMHANPKSNLSNEDRTKSKYAIPIVSYLEQGINHQDRNTELFNYDDKIGITINYSILQKIAQGSIIMYRSEEDINKILKEYNRLQNTA